MSRGKTKQKSPHNGLDMWAERLNNKIARLMGKKDKLPKAGKTSNLTFSIMVMISAILLWVSTGFYYLGEGQFGLILQNGRVIKVVKGIKVGFTCPYPFGNIEAINAKPGDLIDLANMSSTSPGFKILSQDIYPLQVTAKFSYQVIKPKLVFQTLIQKQDNLNAYVTWQLQVALHNYFMYKKNPEIIKANLTVTANEIKDNLNKTLAKSGLELVKLNIYSLQSAQTTEFNNVESEAANNGAIQPQIDSNVSVLVEQVVAEAKSYQQNLVIDTQANINLFNQILPQYQANRTAIAQQMYYDALSAIPLPQINNYSLLDLPLSELLMHMKVISTAASQTNASGMDNLRERHFDRAVRRYRNIDGGNE